MSLPEVLLWRHLKGSPGGIQFRKQHPIGDYFLDFYVARLKLAIEIDGIAHDMGDRPQRDEARDAYLAARGLRWCEYPQPTF
jgi:very-short-patch-repair endonuclease